MTGEAKRYPVLSAKFVTLILMMKSKILEVIAFISGFALMAFELAAARILAPSIGSSTYVWTSVIGVIIAALSLGYYTGGKLADNRNRSIDVAWLSLASATAIVMVLLTYSSTIAWIIEVFDDARIQGVVASLVLFAPASFLLGMLSPYLVKLKITSLETSGQSVAGLSALNSIGGIIGTFVTGFILFSVIGSREIFALVALMMLIVSWGFAPRHRLRGRIVLSSGLLFVVALSLTQQIPSSIDTPSARYEIIEGSLDNRAIRGIATGPNGIQSAVYQDGSDELVFWYTQQMAEIVELAPSKERILILGGGTLTLPQYLAEKYPASAIDVVEIDPELAWIARERFNYTDPRNVTLYFDDARAYVNQTQQQYDVILVDVYSDTSVPFSLITAEYGQQIERIITNDGVVAANMIAGPFGACGTLLAALDVPYAQLDRVSQYKMQRSNQPRSNLIAVYSVNRLEWEGARSFGHLNRRPSYTDNFAPIEALQQACTDSTTRYM